MDVTFAVEVAGLHRTYHTGEAEVQALRGVNLTVKGGQFVAVKGRSGSGKTTLLNCIGGLDQPTSGSVYIHGQNIFELSERDRTRWRREQVGFVFQSFGLLPTLSAYENVELLPRMSGVRYKERHHRTLKSLHQVGLDEWIHHRPSELSGGQQQRVAIARAIINSPKLILADEPTGELDSNTAREILALFRSIVTEGGITVLMVSHDLLVDEYVHEIFHLQDGQIAVGNPVPESNEGK